VATKTKIADLGPLSLPTNRFPTGWFQVAWSDEIPPGEVKLVSYFSENIVLWRGESGKLNALDAYCQHLGANIGVGGKVRGEDVECPWHGWNWSGEGLNTLIPYSKLGRNTRVQIKAWPLREWYGTVLVWHDVKGRKPLWEPPAVPELDGDEYYRIAPDMRVVHRIKAHPQMVVENAADAFHVGPVHGGGDFPEILEFNFHGHSFDAKVGITYGSGKTSTWLTPQGAVRAAVVYEQYGIGQGFVRWPEQLVKAVQITNVTPIDGSYSDYWFCMTTVREPGDDAGPTGRARKMIDLQMKIIEQDFFTWENMKVLHTPNFAPEEAKYYGGLRRWAWQFYPGARPGNGGRGNAKKKSRK
jgi:phenylpropionate dioxygenase-like ring-hydroxylating dioxygenase large terminal subunit